VKKSEVPLGHNLETELRNICVNIPLLQAIKDIPIYAKIVRDLCIKNQGGRGRSLLLYRWLDNYHNLYQKFHLNIMIQEIQW
jgi:hypothetical protein